MEKIIANVLNVRVEIISNDEGPAFGGAILAAVGCGEYPDIKTASSKFIKVINTIEPQANLVEKYEKNYQKFKAIYPSVKALF